MFYSLYRKVNSMGDCNRCDCRFCLDGFNVIVAAVYVSRYCNSSKIACYKNIPYTLQLNALREWKFLINICTCGYPDIMLGPTQNANHFSCLNMNNTRATKINSTWKSLCGVWKKSHILIINGLQIIPFLCSSIILLSLAFIRSNKQNPKQQHWISKNNINSVFWICWIHLHRHWKPDC